MTRLAPWTPALCVALTLFSACSEGQISDQHTGVLQADMGRSSTLTVATATNFSSTTPMATIMVLNQPPVASIRVGDAPAIVGVPFELEGTFSVDPEGGELAYTWRLLGDSGARFIGQAGSRAQVVASVAGPMRVGLVVIDDKGAKSEQAEVTVNVEAPRINRPPEARATAKPLEAMVGQPVVLDASGSLDPDGDPLQTRWSVVQMPPGSGAMIADEAASITALTPDLPGTYDVAVIVSDAKTEDTARMRITVLAPNLPPVAALTLPAQAVVGTPVTLDASGSRDPEGEDVAFAWHLTQAPGQSDALALPGQGATASFTPGVVGVHTIEVTVTDGAGLKDLATALLNVVPPPNAPPVADAGAPAFGWPAQRIAVDGSGSLDVEDAARGLTPLYSWALVSSPPGVIPVMGDLDKPTAWLSTPEPGEYEMELTVTDSLGQSQTDRVSVLVQCVLISEVLEGSSNNKVVEIANCGSKDVQLAGVHLCQINNANHSCTPSRDLALQGSLRPDQTMLLCNTNLDQSILPMGTYCDVLEASVMTFNGNDRLLLYHEESGMAGFQPAGDRRLDAFGQESLDPGLIWSDTTYTRCDLTPYDGTGPFSAALPTWHALAGLNDASGLGVAFSGCP